MAIAPASEKYFWLSPVTKRDADVLASGRVFNRKRAPDLTLRVSFAPPGG